MGAICRGIHSSSVCILSTLNVLIALCSILVCISITSALISPAMYLKKARPQIDKFNEIRGKIASQVGLNIEKMDLEMITGSILEGLLCVSILSFLISSMGCIGICLHSKPLLITYIVLMLILFMVFLGLYTSISYGRKRLANLKTFMKKRIRKSYNGTLAVDSVSLMMNVLMIGTHCCGVDNYKDFEGASIWKGSMNITMRNYVIPINASMPLACCKMEVMESVIKSLDNYNQTTQVKYEPNHPVRKDLECTSPSSALNNKDKGCYDAMWDLMEPFAQSTLLSVVSTSLLVFLALSILITAVEIQRTTASEENQVVPDNVDSDQRAEPDADYPE